MDHEAFASACYTLTDEDGNEIEFEVIGRCEYNGTEYLAMIPTDATFSDECEYSILKTVSENGEEWLSTLEDDAEFEAVAERFDALFAEEMEND